MWRKFWNDQKGISLTEIVIGLVIGMIIVVAAGGIFLSSGRTLSYYAKIRDHMQLIDTLSKLFRKQLLYADGLEISNRAESEFDGDHVIQISAQGKVYIDGIMLYQDSDYQDRKVVCQISTMTGNDQEHVLSMELLLENGDGEILQNRKMAIHLINLELGSVKKQIVYTAKVEMNGIISSAEQDLYLHYRFDSVIEDSAAANRANGGNHETHTDR